MFIFISPNPINKALKSPNRIYSWLKKSGILSAIVCCFYCSSDDDLLVNDLQKTYDKISQDIQLLESELKSVIAENADLKRQVEALENQHSLLQTEFETATKNRQELEIQWASLNENLKKHIDDSMAEQNSLQSQIDDLKKELEEIEGQNIDDLKKKNIEQQNRLLELIGLHAEFQKEIRDREAQLTLIMEEIEGLQNITSQLENKKKELDNALEELKKSKERMAQLESQISQVSTTQVIGSVSSEELVQLQNRFNELKNELEEYQNLKESIENQNQTLKELEQLKTQYDQLLRQQNISKTSIEQLEREIEQLNRRISCFKLTLEGLSC